MSFADLVRINSSKEATPFATESRHNLNNATRNSNGCGSTYNNDNQIHSAPTLTINCNNEVPEKQGQVDTKKGSCVPTCSKKEQLIASKPPLPTSVLLNRPPTRFSTSSHNAQMPIQWGSSTTPRMRISARSDLPPLTTGGRPVSPLANGRRGSTVEPFGNTDAILMPSIAKKHSTSGSPQFLYNGPHQIYGGPTTKIHSEGPMPLNLLLNASEEPSVRSHASRVFKGMQSSSERSSLSKITPDNTPSGHLNRTETEQEVLINVMEKTQQPSPLESQHASLLLKSSSLSGSQSASFPSTHALTQMGTAPLVGKDQGEPFANSGIPNEIQDDLLRIEMLLEFRKCKEALNRKIQNQNEILQLVNSGQCHLNSSVLFQNPQGFNNNPKSSYNLQYPQQQQQQYQPHWYNTLSTVMASPQPSSNSNSNSPGGGLGGVASASSNLNAKEWQEDKEQLNTANFVLNTFMEPHHILPNQNTNQNPPSFYLHSPQYSNSSNDKSSNDKNPINLLQTKNFDEFQAMAEQSRNGFSEEMMKQNPLLAGAHKYQEGSSTYPFFTAKPTNPESSGVTKGTPLRIQVAPKSSSSQQEQQQVNERPPTVQQQYQQFLLDKNFQSLSPSSFKMMEPMGQDSMLRKPVAVFPNNFSTNSGSPSSLNATTTTLADADSSSVRNRPSPFFPGFSENPINMKIRTPEEKTSQKSENRGGTEAANHLEAVEELSSLLKQLPVLTRREKVEEFQAINTLKPATPVTDAESETSMIPLVSSNGTLVSDKRQDSVDTKLSKAVAEEIEFKNVDPNKLNINELVTLGRKIYRILSEASALSTNPLPELNSPTSPPRLITTPLTLKVSSPNTQGLSPKGHKSLTKQPSRCSTCDSPQMIVDFNTIPNPTFVTGPGLINSKSTAKIDSPSAHRTRSPIGPPNLFRKILQPPPTRWEGKSNPGSDLPASTSRLSGFVNPHPHKQSPAYNKQRQRPSRTHFSRRSMSSISGNTVRPGSKYYEKTMSKVQRAVTPVRFVPSFTRLPDSFAVRERYNHNNNYSTKNMTRHRRQSTPYPYQQAGSAEVDSGTSMAAHGTITTTVITPNPTRASSVGRRNFILENISKLRTMKKLPDHRLQPRQLPPVSKKRYENVQSTIPGSRSRSNSHNHKDDRQHTSVETRYRSSSVPATTAGGGCSQSSRCQPNRSGSTPRPSTGMSVNLSSSKSQSSTQTQMQAPSTGRPLSQGILRPIIGSTTKGSKTRVSTYNSKVKFDKLPSKTSIGKGEVFEGSKNSLRSDGRKSRSKTKRVSILQKKNSVVISRNSSVSSIGQQQPREKWYQKTKKSKKEAKQKKAKKPVIIGETVSTEDEAASVPEPLFKSESEQRMIREMVKAEMSMMVEMHVKEVLKDQKSVSLSKGEETDSNNYYRRGLLVESSSQHHSGEDFNDEVGEGRDVKGGHHSNHPTSDSNPEDDPGFYKASDRDHDDTTIIDSENITPVYTPPKYYDESLFALEKWINPDGSSLPGSAYASARERTGNTAVNSVSKIVGFGGEVRKTGSKPQTVRFSLPNSGSGQQQQQSNMPQS